MTPAGEVFADPEPYREDLSEKLPTLVAEDDEGVRNNTCRHFTGWDRCSWRVETNSSSAPAQCGEKAFKPAVLVKFNSQKTWLS